MNKQIDDIYQQVIDEDCDDPLYRFAELVRQDEREACAKVCDDWLVGRDDICEVAKAIRGRGEK
jgi:hypothetical protein